MSSTTELPTRTELAFTETGWLWNGATVPFRNPNAVWESDPNGGRRFYRHADEGPGTLSYWVRETAYRENETRSTVDSTDFKLEAEATAVGATAEQLQRLRSLAEDSRDLIRVRRELEEARTRLAALESDEITRYDERIRPMLEDLAALAERRGFCGEFDLVLEHIGAPSREDLKPTPTTFRYCLDVVLHVDLTGDEDEDMTDLIRRAIYDLDRSAIDVKDYTINSQEEAE